jgi:L-ascorbate metabolism protein UlaG (beta-lactamase superfamily)
MNITWYGQRCVRIEAKEGSILVDPFGKEAGLRGPKMNDDLVLISPYAAPAGVREQIPDESLVIHGPGEYERKGIAVRGIPAFSDSQKGKELGLATLYTIMADEMLVCHLGALGQAELTAEQLESIGDPDILIIPVGEQGALDAKAAAELVNQIEPKVIMPIGQGVDKFVKEIGLPVQKADTFRITKKQLPTDQTQLVVLAA